MTATNPVTAFANDVGKMTDEVINHEASGAYAAIMLSAILTFYVWYRYGPTAGAPLAASLFICIAMVLPSTTKP